MISLSDAWHQALEKNVLAAIDEDIGTGDITARLIDAEQIAHAHIISRDEAVIAGRPWFDRVFRQIDQNIVIEWHVDEGDWVSANTKLVSLKGSARSLLIAERCALNFLQTLSAVATKTAKLKQLINHTHANLFDTRKTLPGLRVAQKYAVQCGGGQNHRLGLYDAFLIKENHIAACGSIEKAILAARNQAPPKPVEIEVESEAEFIAALNAKADIIMLDNFSNDEKKAAVNLRNKQQSQTQLEASGGINETTLVAVAETGVERISLGTLTKDILAVDLSMRLSPLH